MPLELASDEARVVRLPAQPMPALAVARSEWLCSLSAATGGGSVGGAETLLLLAGRRTGELLAWACELK